VLIGKYRLPWSFRIWRGAGQRSPAELALKLLSGLPAFFKQSFAIRVLAAGDFSSAVFLNGVVKLGVEALVAIRCDRRLDQGGSILTKRNRESTSSKVSRYRCGQHISRYRVTRKTLKCVME
jgi:hypothetical protein